MTGYNHKESLKNLLKEHNIHDQAQLSAFLKPLIAIMEEMPEAGQDKHSGDRRDDPSIVKSTGLRNGYYLKAVWVLLTVTLEIVIVIWPMLGIFLHVGFKSVWVTTMTYVVTNPVLLVPCGTLFLCLLSCGIAISHVDLFYGIVASLGYFFIYGLLIGIMLTVGGNIDSIRHSLFGGGLFGLCLTFLGGFMGGIITDSGNTFMDNVRRLRRRRLFKHSIITLVLMIVTLSFINAIAFSPIFAIGFALSMSIGLYLSMSLNRGFKLICEKGAYIVKCFFSPQLDIPFRGSILGLFISAVFFFVIIYAATALLFSIWFYAGYLENPNFFSIGGSANWFDFAYFSFVTITTLGYGDIAPLHSFPRVLVIIETLMGMSLCIVYFGIVLHVTAQLGLKFSKKIDKSNS